MQRTFLTAKKLGLSLITSSALFLAMVSTVNAGNVYRWTDSNGTVHYSQHKPKNNDNVEQLNIRGGNVKAYKLNNEKKSNKEYPVKKSKDQKDEQVKKLEDKLKKQNEAINKERCSKLKSSIDNLKDGGRIYEMKDGKRQYLTNQEMQERQQKYANAYQNDCN